MYHVAIYTDDLATALRHLQTEDRAVNHAVLFGSINPKLPNYLAPIAEHRPGAALHFIGFSDSQQYHNAARVFGQPDFVHRVWDTRAAVEIAEGDIAIFAKYDPDMPPSPYAWDDSAQPDDPATHERLIPKVIHKIRDGLD